MAAPAQQRQPHPPLNASSRRHDEADHLGNVADEDGGYNLPGDMSSVEEAGIDSPVRLSGDSRDAAPDAGLGTRSGPGSPPDQPQARPVSAALTELYTVSYLVLFAILGTLARLGLQAITSYPDSPTIFSSLWPNFAGSLVMGFLAEDRRLFLHERGILRPSPDKPAAANDDPAATKKAHLAVKKTIPLYIGLATGFCGSFTSFSAFIRDMFLALSNDLSPSSQSTTTPRNGGHSFEALLAVLIVTVSLSLAGLFTGAHLAAAVERYIPSISFRFMDRMLDRAAVILGFGCWLGAVLLTALPPSDNWRGAATFALVFAPPGCLLRFYISAWLNKRRANFPWGTFAVNVLGTLVLGIAWDVQHVPLGGVLGCQALQGIEDGFCGCLTTVSTWVAELESFRGGRRRNAYIYGAASVAAGFAVLVAVMGGLRWTDGFAALQCSH